MARKGENIYKRKDGRWEARFIKSHQFGKAVYSSVYGKSYSEVKKKRSEAMANIKPEKSSSASAQPNLRQISAMWLDSLKSTRKASTIVKYSNQLDKHILPVFGDCRMSEISNEDLIDFGNKLFTGKNTLSDKSVSDIISRMKSIRKYALIHGYDVGFVPECITVPQKQRTIRVLSIEEENVLLDFLKDHPDLTSLGILICLFTGIRIGELCALTWNSISIETKKLTITRTMQRLQNLDKDAPSDKISFSQMHDKLHVSQVTIIFNRNMLFHIIAHCVPIKQKGAYAPSI